MNSKAISVDAHKICPRPPPPPFQLLIMQFRRVMLVCATWHQQQKNCQERVCTHNWCTRNVEFNGKMLNNIHVRFASGAVGLYLQKSTCNQRERERARASLHNSFIQSPALANSAPQNQPVVGVRLCVLASVCSVVGVLPGLMESSPCGCAPPLDE